MSGPNHTSFATKINAINYTNFVIMDR